MAAAPINSTRDLAAVARGRRRELGLSQTELARRAGVSRQWVSAFEAGKPGAELRLVIDLLGALDLRLLVDDGGPASKPDAGAGVDLDALLDEHRDR
jgi:HTH-type transcriptional regulator / antitoxin HipB